MWSSALLLCPAIAAPAWPQDLCKPMGEREECGYPGIDPTQCHARGCCFNSEAAGHWCSKGTVPCISRAVTCNDHGDCIVGNMSLPNRCQCDAGFVGSTCASSGPPTPPPPPPTPDYADIEVVHVINSCHLDIGFADSSVGIVNRYFDHHFPLAIQVGQELRAQYAGQRTVPNRLNFMFQSWVVSMYLDCPAGMGFHCPNTAQITAFEAAVAAGDITWHAFPHNAELEMMDPSLIEAGLALTWALDTRFNLPRKQTLSQRDVPGMTRALVPLLSKAGVTAISIGANDGSTPPSVPKFFQWIDTASNTSLLGLFNWPGYGGISNGPVVVPGSKHALVYNWNGDNAGPFSASAYTSTFASLGKTFPNAQIRASTFDNFTSNILPLLGTKNIPVFTEEMGDTWVYGCPSDPQKVARLRVINRAWRAEADRRGGSFLHGHTPLGTTDAVLLNATRFALKLGEHTWGRDVKSNLKDNDNWKNVDFWKAKVPPASTAPQYEILEDSWWEQRHWGITLAIDTLVDGNHPMAADLVSQMSNLKPEVPQPESHGFVTAAPGTTFKCGATAVSFDDTGALSQLGSWVSGQVLSLRYRQYSAADVASFFSQYCKSNAGWVQHDYGKPNLPGDVPSALTSPTLKALWKKSTASGDCDFAAELVFSQEASTMCGAPQTAWMNLSINSDDSADVVIGLFNKTQTRLPEAMFLQFTPTVPNGTWSANKLGEWIRSDEIVDGGTKHLHGVTEEGLRFQTPSGQTLGIASTDAGVANFGNLTAYPSPVHTDADTETFGASFVLWDNLWGTNYIMWWPFEQPPPQDYSGSSKYFPADWNDDMVSRYRLTW
mmetsp:Transcript_35724/g.93375  ORF Transcript_35724/g.93375 Transcript_35724/m.93375 type:complete len:832 (-) Transcript_35724:153-2648(-)